MSDKISRRKFLSATGVAGVAATAGCINPPGNDGVDNDTNGNNSDDNNSDSSDDESGPASRLSDEQVSYLDNARMYDGEFEDLRGEGTVNVSVGAGSNGFAFDPAAIWIEQGQTVEWEWTGVGGQHNVVSRDDSYESELVDDESHTFTQTFEESQVSVYLCTLHEAAGMKGVVVVGEQ